jgi:hypothetical protein
MIPLFHPFGLPEEEILPEIDPPPRTGKAGGGAMEARRNGDWVSRGDAELLQAERAAEPELNRGSRTRAFRFMLG